MKKEGVAQTTSSFLMENEIEQDKDVKDEYSEVICYLLPLVFEILRKLS